MSINQVDAGVGAAARIAAVAGELSSLVARLDPAVLTGSDAAGLTEVFARLERLAMAGKTLAAGRVAECGHYRAAGFSSAPQWLAKRTGATRWEAAKAIETAQLMGDDALAPTRAARAEGALTAVQASEIASASAAAPEEQDRLLALAGVETTARLRDECRQVRLASREPEDHVARRRRVVAEMAFGHRDLGGGMGELFARMPTSWLARVLAAVRDQGDEVFARARAEGRSDPHQAYLVEALVGLVLFGNGDDVAADRGGGVDGGEGGPPADTSAADEPSEDRGDPMDDPLYDQLLAAIRGPAPPARPGRQRRRRCRCGGRAGPRAKIIVRVDQSALLRGHAGAGEVCDIPGVGPVPVATVRELWPDAVVALVVTKGVEVRNVTSLGRRATAAMETAMQFAVPRCTNVACDNDQFVQIDHRLGYANTRRTRLGELDHLCSCCHHLKTTENWQLVRGVGRRRFVPPRHPDHPGDPSTPRRRMRSAA